MSNKKKYLIIASIMVVIVMILLVSIQFLKSDRNILWINWELYLPTPTKVEKIYNAKSSEGISIEIWHYEENQMSKIKKQRYAVKINEENKIDVKNIMEKFYSVLSEKEEQLFNGNVDIEKIIIENNYYIYIPKEYDKRTYLFIILDCKNNLMYYFTDIY